MSVSLDLYLIKSWVFVLDECMLADIYKAESLKNGYALNFH